MSSDRQYKSTAANLLILTACFATALFVIVLISNRIYRPAKNEEGFERIYDKYYVIVTDEYRSSFWQTVCEGARGQAASQNAYVELLGERLTEKYSASELMEIAIASGVDGIMVCGNKDPEMVELIGAANDSGIPVVTMYRDIEPSERISYVGVSGYNIGSEYGRQIVNVLNEKRMRAMPDAENGSAASDNNRDDVRITVLSDPQISSDQNVILSGIWDVLNSEDYGADFAVDTLYVDDSNPFSVEESLRGIFMDEAVPDVIIAMSEIETTSAYQATIDYNKVGSVYILGYYDSKKILNAISRNVVFSTISVDTEELGRYGIDALTDFSETGNTSEYFAADIILVDKNNISEYVSQEEKTDGT